MDLGGWLRVLVSPATIPSGEGNEAALRAGGQPVKARRRKAVTLKHRNAPKVTRSRPSSVGGKDKKIALLTRELHEALEQQTATADVSGSASSNATVAASIGGCLRET
jgi:hypothetical protein